MNDVCVRNSVGEVVDIAQEMVSVPIYKIDEPMAEKAVQLGKRIAVVATVSSTMGPKGSMIVLSPLLRDIRVPVLTSPRLGVERIRRALYEPEVSPGIKDGETRE